MREKVVHFFGLQILILKTGELQIRLNGEFGISYNLKTQALFSLGYYKTRPQFPNRKLRPIFPSIVFRLTVLPFNTITELSSGLKSPFAYIPPRLITHSIYPSGFVD